MIVALSRFRPPPGAAESLVESFTHRSRAVDTHAGFLGFEVLRSFEPHPEFLLITRWKDRDSLKAYLSTVVTRISLDVWPILIGGADDSTLVLDDDFASTRHARLSMRGTDWYVEDLGSTNGTYLDRAKVTAPLRVPLGTPIRIGKTVIELRS